MMSRREYVQLLGTGPIVGATATHRLGSASNNLTTDSNDGVEKAQQLAAFDAKIDDNYGNNSAGEYHEVFDGIRPAGGLSGGEVGELRGLEYIMTVYFESPKSDFTASVFEWECSKSPDPGVIGVRSNHFSTGEVFDDWPNDETGQNERWDDAEHTFRGELSKNVIAFDNVMATTPDSRTMRVNEYINFQKRLGQGIVFNPGEKFYNHITTSHKPDRTPWHLTVYWRAYWDIHTE